MPNVFRVETIEGNKRLVTMPHSVLKPRAGDAIGTGLLIPYTNIKRCDIPDPEWVQGAHAVVGGKFVPTGLTTIASLRDYVLAQINTNIIPLLPSGFSAVATASGIWISFWVGSNCYGTNLYFSNIASGTAKTCVLSTQDSYLINGEWNTSSAYYDNFTPDVELESDK
jgi:hypothetical protein